MDPDLAFSVNGKPMTDSRPEILAPFPVCITIPVAWGEMDAMQHVNNIIYFRYMETARFAYFERIGFLGPQENGIGPILGSARCVFKFPLTYPDRVWVGAKATQIGDDRFTMRHRIYSESHGRIAADGEGVLVAFDYAANKKAELPPVIRQRIAECEHGYPSLND